MRKKGESLFFLEGVSWRREKGGEEIEVWDKSWVGKD